MGSIAPRVFCRQSGPKRGGNPQISGPILFVHPFIKHGEVSPMGQIPSLSLNVWSQTFDKKVIH